jgi:hypothetical protein
LLTTFRAAAAGLRSKWPEAATVVDRLAEAYEHDAEHEDAVAAADRRRYGIEPPTKKNKSE